jgi:hypothetical protein
VLNEDDQSESANEDDDELEEAAEGWYERFETNDDEKGLLKIKSCHSLLLSRIKV